MALFDDINKAKDELAKLRKEYQELEGKSAPLFDVTNVDDANKAIDVMNKSLAESKRRADDLESGFGGIYDRLKGITEELTKSQSPQKLITKEFNSQTRIVRKLKDDQQGINKLSMKELQDLKSKQASSKDLIQTEGQRLVAANRMKTLEGEALEAKIKTKLANNEISEEEAAIIRGYKEGFSVLDDIEGKLDQRIAKEKNLQDALGVTGGVLSGFKGALQGAGFGGLAGVLNLDEANKAMEETAEKLGISDTKAASFGDKLKIAAAGAGELGKGLFKALTDPASAMAFLSKGLMDAFKHIDADTAGIAKNMNMSYNEALKVTKELKTQALESGDVFVTTAGMVETMGAVNASLGTSVKLSKEQATEFTSMREQAGFTNEELLGIQALSATTGKSMKEISGEFMAQARLKAQEFGVALNEKDLLKDIQNVSAATTLSFGKNPGLIAEAVAATKALGLEMGKVEGIADSLLDFEGSIAKEMEAELLLGKNLNLEKARQAALDNDLVTLSEEIAKNVGDSADFAAMNRLQQEALADSVGMSREELANMLFTQEQLVGLSAEETAIREKQIKELEAEGLSQAEIKERLANTSIAQLEEQAGITDRINASIEKMKEAFGAVALAIAPLVSGMASFFAYLAESPMLMGALLSVLGGIAAIQATIALVSMKAAIAKIFAGSFIAGPFGLPIALAGVAALGAAVAGINSMMSSGDDIISPGGSGGGYGKRTLFGPEGAIALNNKDTVIAGTNLFRGNDVVSAPAGAISMNQGNASSEKTNQLLTQMVSFQKKQPGFSRVALYKTQ